jgi:hypothetical protein
VKREEIKWMDRLKYVRDIDERKKRERERIIKVVGLNKVDKESIEEGK